MKDFSKEIRAYSLQNAIEFGKADAGRILPKLFQHGLKKDEIKGVMPEIQKIVKEINSLSSADKEKEWKGLENVVKKHEENEERELPELKKTAGMTFRLAPFPSGALHLGNAKTFLLNAIYAEKYKAKTLLIIDDTIGSEEKQPQKESYGLIEDAFKWLGVKYKKPVIYKSDRLEIYYEYAEKLMKLGKAYVCHCEQETLRKNRADGIECGCRILPSDVQLLRWENMFEEPEGHAVVRLKTNMQHPNPAFRDRVLFKISDRAHPRIGKKYRVWPTLEMSWAVDDHLLKITHILRGNDLMIETDMEKYIWDIFKWKHCETIHTGLVTIDGIGGKLSKSKSQKEVKSGTFMGWDDPRTWSIQSLRRRGITPEAIRAFVKGIGVNKNDITVPIESLYAENRKIIDAKTERYAFVEDPVEIEIENNPGIKHVDVKIHPDREETRRLMIGKLFIAKKDFEAMKGKETRLIHLFNVDLKSNKKAKVTSIDNKNIEKIQWVSHHVPCSILMPDGNSVVGIAEESVSKLKPGAMIQFERVGFARFDKNNKGTYEFWFAHR